jgi:hypothetical protein
VSPAVFDVSTTDGGYSVLKIVIDAQGAESGVYGGKLYIINPRDSPFVIPITLTIRDPIWFGLFLVGLGVALNFLVKVFSPKKELTGGLKLLVSHNPAFVFLLRRTTSKKVVVFHI